MISSIKNLTIVFIILTLTASCNKSGNRLSDIQNNLTQKDTIIYSVSATISGFKYRADYRSNSFLYIITNKNDTIMQQKEVGLSPIPLVFEDYNNDGYLDIRFGYNSNYYFETIMLYNPKTKGFTKIADIDKTEYAYSKNIRGTEYYYSYSVDGCGKKNWLSTLFIIVDYKIVPLGLIRFRQCDDDNKGIFVYKLNRVYETLLENYSIVEENKHSESFYEYYWVKNYKKFKLASP